MSRPPATAATVRPARQCAGVRGGVDAAGQAGDDDQPATRQFGGKVLGHALAVGGGVAAADQRDGAG